MMKRVLALVFLAVLLLSGAGSASHFGFFPLSEHTIAKVISSNGMPLYRTNTFTSDDDQVVSWLLIWRDSDSHTVEWRWYWPEGRTYSRSFSTIPPIDGFTGMWAAPVWSCLDIKGTDVARLPGTWKVDVIVDYRKVLTERFTITNPDAC
ncbi:MAG TPA: hypothetical protein PKL29_01755 [Methanothrix sp.]|nr:hypothetical protein [Methanothrix sp.]